MLNRMSIKQKLQISKHLLLALKVGVGASAAYFIAEFFHLKFASSAGIIALLTLQTTRWDTIRLSARRLISFFLTYGLCFSLPYLVKIPWLDYGLYVIIFAFVCEILGWRNVVSVNAVIGAHFLSTRNFSLEFMLNELYLVLIGITIAILLNLFHINSAYETNIIKNMRHVEHEMKKILMELAGYLRHQEMGKHVWDDTIKLEDELSHYLDVAHEYQGNTFGSHPGYYVNYFRMRMEQCGALLNMHKELQRISEMPQQADIVSEYILDMCEHVTEMNHPEKQMAQLERVVADIKNHELPKTREEFESRALLYHVLAELEDFLLYKKRFVESSDEEQFQMGT